MGTQLKLPVKPVIVWAGGALCSLAVKGPLSCGWPDDDVGEGFYGSC